MNYYIEIEMDNESFQENTQEELKRIVNECAKRISLLSFGNEKAQYPIYDINGNQVGYHGYENKKN